MIDDDFDDLSDWKNKVKKKIDKLEEKIKIFGTAISGKKGFELTVPKELEESVKKLQRF